MAAKAREWTPDELTTVRPDHDGETFCANWVPPTNFPFYSRKIHKFRQGGPVGPMIARWKREEKLGQNAKNQQEHVPEGG